MPTYDEILAQAKDPAYTRTTTARVLLRQDLAAQIEALDEEAKAALEEDVKHNRPPVAPEIARKIQELQALAEKEMVEFKFKSIGKKAWADLIKLHPPTKDQRRDHPNWDHNPETFQVAAIAASSLDPVMSLQQAQEFERLANVTTAVWGKLWLATVEANLSGADVPKAENAGRILLRSGASGQQPTTFGSLAQSS